jgi:tetratricopeptide (TPR) repeat protein
LDYYLSGVKIDPTHLGCIHNVGCCQYFAGKYQNALKWFNLAIRVDPAFQDSYFGSTMASIKLGHYEDALKTIQTLNCQEWATTSYL